MTFPLCFRICNLLATIMSGETYSPASVTRYVEMARKIKAQQTHMCGHTLLVTVINLLREPVYSSDQVTAVYSLQLRSS